MLERTFSCGARIHTQLLTERQYKSDTILERQPAREVSHEAMLQGTLERVPQSVVQVAGD